MAEYGYARVSTIHQDARAQVQALVSAGVPEENIVVETGSGAGERPGLTALLAQLEEGDRISVWKLDRLGRRLAQLTVDVEDLGNRGVQFRSLTEQLDTTSPYGRVIFAVYAAMAEAEREMIRERTLAGLEIARSRNKRLGRPSKVTPDQQRWILRMAAEGESQRKIAATTGISKSVVGRVLRGELPSLPPIEPDRNELPFYGA